MHFLLKRNPQFLHDIRVFSTLYVRLRCGVWCVCGENLIFTLLCECFSLDCIYVCVVLYVLGSRSGDSTDSTGIWLHSTRIQRFNWRWLYARRLYFIEKA